MEKGQSSLRDHLRVAGRAAFDGTFTGVNLYVSSNMISEGKLTIPVVLLTAFSLGINDKMIINSIRFVRELKKYG